MTEEGEGIDVEVVSASLMEPVFAVEVDGEISFANERFLSITQQDRESVLGTDWASFGRFVESGFPALQDAVDSVGRGEDRQVRVELGMCHPPDAPVHRRMPAEARVTPIDVDGAVRGVLVTLRNITERKGRERELERKNDRLDEFAGVVSHDLRNPLNVADGYLDLAREECDSAHLDAVGDALDRMSTIVDDTLLLARQGRSVGERECVDVAALAEECWGHVHTADATLDVVDEFSVTADRERACHLFENLFRNCVEHGSTSGRTSSDDAVEYGGDGVTVTVGSLDSDGFYVEDDGPGIAAPERDTVFAPGHTSGGDGTGFGLAIVKRIAEAHGWETTVTDGRDGGARFEFTGVEAPTSAE